jgi:hypothetical protein
VRVRGQPREHERAHRDDHRRWEQRAAAVADELRDERRPEEPDLDVEQVARQPAAQGDGAGDLRARTVDRRERIAARRRAQRLCAEVDEVAHAGELDHRERPGRGGQQRGDAEHRCGAPHEVAQARAGRRPRSRARPVGERGAQDDERVGAGDHQRDGRDGHEGEKRCHGEHLAVAIGSIQAMLYHQNLAEILN